MTSILLLFLVAGSVLVISAIGVGVVALWRRPGAPKKSIIAVIVLLLLGTPVALAVHHFTANDQSVVWVNGVSYEDNFILELPHHRNYVSGEEYYFSVRLTWQDLVQELDAQHPAGVEFPNNTWVFIDAETPALVRPAVDSSADFVMIAQVASLSLAPKSSDGVIVRFPYPDSEADGFFFDVGVPTKSHSTFQELSDFYGGIAGAEVGENSISVPSSASSNVLLEFSDGDITVSTP